MQIDLGVAEFPAAHNFLAEDADTGFHPWYVQGVPRNSCLSTANQCISFASSDDPVLDDLWNTFDFATGNNAESTSQITHDMLFSGFSNTVEMAPTPISPLNDQAHQAVALEHTSPPENGPGMFLIPADTFKRLQVGKPGPAQCS